MDGHTQLVAWAVIALGLLAAEALAPGAFMLWLGIAATLVFVIVLLFPALPVLAQIVAFVALSFVAVQFYRGRMRTRGLRPSDRPSLNRRAEQLVGRVVPLERGIVNGQGQVQIADALWDVRGEELPAGTPVRIVAVEGMTLRVVPA